MVAENIIEKARDAHKTLLTEIEAKQLLQQAGIDVVETILATSKDEAVAISEQIGFPVVMKIASTDVVHKSDCGGVKIGLKNSGQVEDAYDDIINSVKQMYPEVSIDGVSVQAMASQGVEVIIGMSKDPQFGPVLMFGLGGILVEILKDVSFRIVPLKPQDAAKMIREIKGYPLLEGYRGSDPIDIEALEKILLNLSAFMEKTPAIKELDMNPIFAYKEGAVAVDARVILEPQG